MQIEHVAIWTESLEDLSAFYQRYFDGTAGELFVISETGFRSQFISFRSGARLELMSMPSVPSSLDNVERQFTGYIHIAFEIPSRSALDALVATITAGGHRVLEVPYVTADGYYEATVLDPSGNRVELSCAVGTGGAQENT